MILSDDKLLPLRTWIYSKVKKNNPNILHSIWVNCQNPETVLVSEYAEIEENVILHQGVEIRGQSKIDKNTVIDIHSVVTSSLIGSYCHLNPNTIIEQSIIGDNCELGPHTLIQLSSLGDRSRIGFTAQIKRSKLGARTHAMHHCYIGDTEAGEGVNFGAGSITGNYDGSKKNKTIIGDNVFIGTNINMVAPITIGNESFIAAGSTVTQKISIPPHSFVIARAPAHVSENIYSMSTEQGYEFIHFGKERLVQLRAFFGEEFPYWLEERNMRFGNKSPLEVFRSNIEQFDQIVEQLLHSSTQLLYIIK